MSTEIFFDVIKHTSGLSVLVPLISCFYRMKALNQISIALFIYLLISVTADLMGLVFMRNQIKTYVIFNSFTIAECSLFIFIYLSQFEGQQTKMLIKVFFLIFLILAFFIFVLNKGFNKQDSVLSSYEAVLLITLSISYFYKVMSELNIAKLNDYYFAWINTGVLIYFIIGFLLFFFSGYIERRGLRTHNFLYSLHWISNIAYNILLALGIWKIKPTWIQ